MKYTDLLKKHYLFEALSESATEFAALNLILSDIMTVFLGDISIYLV